MSTTGSFADCSLAELFKLLDIGQKTGLLKLRILSESPAASPLIYYIWLHHGCVVAVANQLDQQGLVSLIARCFGVKNRLVAELAQSCPSGQPLGLYLKERLVLESEQLKRLFKIQVLQRVCALFEMNEGQFEFEQNVPIPTREMTGLSVPLVVLNQYCCLNFISEKAAK